MGTPRSCHRVFAPADDGSTMTEGSDDAPDQAGAASVDTPAAGSENAAIDPAELFGLLGDETRQGIVRTLHETSGPLSFSALQDASDVADSGRFNYHLDQLRDVLVAEREDGYVLTAAGDRIARAIAAGTYTHSPTLEPFAMEGTCHACGASALWGSYEDEHFTIECHDCGELVLSVRAPPSLVRGRDPEAFVEAFDRWSRTEGGQALHGICPKCGGPIERSIVPGDFEPVDPEAVARVACEVCGMESMLSLGAVAGRLPAVETFHAERGQHLADRPYWELPAFVSGERVAVESRDPWRVRVTYVAEGDACHVVLDGDLEPVEVRIVPGGA